MFVILQDMILFGVLLQCYCKIIRKSTKILILFWTNQFASIPKIFFLPRSYCEQITKTSGPWSELIGVEGLHRLAVLHRGEF